MEVTKWLKPSDSGSRIGDRRECAGRNASERRANLDTALAAYEARRRPRVEWVQAQCEARDRMRTLPALARSAIVKFLGQTLYRRSYTPLLKPI